MINYKKFYILKNQIRRYWIRFIFYTKPNGAKKANWIKKKKIFYHIGHNCNIKTNVLPAEPFLVCLHNNVFPAAGVRLVTHSMNNCTFNKMLGTDYYRCQHGQIEIHDNVFIGADAIIMYGVEIGENCIVAAGSVVTKDIPSGSVVGGCTAHIIGSFEGSMKKAEAFSTNYQTCKGTSVLDMVKYCPSKFSI